ncbi:tetratricopeptide repeat protein [Actinobacillus capsulatus]|uniref:tetratricopeptide repeat protein n=1 Tax=Actinobacillus capsulatus TaxID=717 RepID=UPI000367E75C|nr:SEL1-like repeat protein [Actinobacillus capsulatus]
MKKSFLVIASFSCLTACVSSPVVGFRPNTLLHYQYQQFEIEYDPTVMQTTPAPRTFTQLEIVKEKAKVDEKNAYLMATLLFHHPNCVSAKKNKTQGCLPALNAYQNVLKFKPDHPLALYQMGVIYDFFLDKKDIKQAIYYYRKAADAGNFRACENLFGIYLNGNVVPQNIEEARYYAQKGAIFGSKQLRYYLEHWNVQIMPYLKALESEK